MRPVAEFKYSHKREITFTEEIVNSPRLKIETLHNNLKAYRSGFDVPQLGFRLKYMKKSGGVDIELVNFFCYLPMIVFPAIRSSLAIKFYPPSVCNRKRNNNAPVQRYLLVSGLNNTDLVGKILILIFVQRDEENFNLVPPVTDRFSRYVGYPIQMTNTSFKTEIPEYLGKIWGDALKNQIIKNQLGKIEGWFGISEMKKGKFYLRTTDNVLVKAKLKDLQQFSPYFQSMKKDNFNDLRQSATLVPCSSEVLRIIYEFVYTARLSRDTCLKLFLYINLLKEILVAADFLLMKDIDIYLDFIVAWKVYSSGACVGELFQLHPYVKEWKTRLVLEALLNAKVREMPAVEVACMRMEYPEIAERLDYLHLHNFFSSRFSSDNDLYWERFEN